MTEHRRAFWAKHPGLTWSNPNADDSTRIRAALVQPRFRRLLDIAAEFGLDRVEKEWDLLSREPNPEVSRAQPAVERILNNIRKGFAIASSRD